MKNFGFLLLICLLHSCHSASDKESYQSSYDSEESFEEEDQASNNLQPEERKIIKTVKIRFQVNDLEESTKKIKTITDKFSGFISSLYQANSNYEFSNNLTIKIPSENLDNFILEIEEESVFTNFKRISSQDVTEEFVDITTRIETKKEVRNRYIEILRNKAKTVQDVLDAEDKIRVIQEEIESIEGRIKYINNQTSLSTIEIELYQEVEYVNTPQVYTKPFFTKIKEGFSNGWSLVLNIVVALVTIWPIILIFLLIFLLRNRFRNLTKK